MSTLKNNKKKDCSILEKEDLKSENIKARITTFLDLDLLDELKSQAKKEHTKYQTLLNSILREKLFGDQSLEQRIDELESKFINYAKETRTDIDDIFRQLKQLTEITKPVETDTVGFVIDK